MPAADSYAALARSSRFKDVKVWAENADRYFPDEEAMVRWVDQPSLVPFLAAIPPDHRKAFRDLVVARMVEETRCDDGRCFETFRRINVSATK